MVVIIGIGMDGKKTLTAEALSAIKNADILIGAKRMSEPFSSLGKPCFCSWKSDEIAEFLHNGKYENAAVLMSGDCGFYSGAEKLLRLTEDIECKVISGISSPVYFCSKIKKPWKNMKFVSLHGESSNIVRNVRRNELCFFLLGGDITPAKLCRRLCEYGMGETKLYIGENLAAENERIYTGKAADFIDIQLGKLTVAVTENPDFENSTNHVCSLFLQKISAFSLKLSSTPISSYSLQSLPFGQSAANTAGFLQMKQIHLWNKVLCTRHLASRFLPDC